jgi:hypothetical protein
MAPFFVHLISRDSVFEASAASGEFRDQWVHPSNVFTVLLILGGDIVGRSIAQLAGGGLTPVTFSFGAILDISMSMWFLC